MEVLLALSHCAVGNRGSLSPRTLGANWGRYGELGIGTSGQDQCPSSEDLKVAKRHEPPLFPALDAHGRRGGGMGSDNKARMCCHGAHNGRGKTPGTLYAIAGDEGQ